VLVGVAFVGILWGERWVGLDLIIPLVTTFAVLNVALMFYPVPRHLRLSVGFALIALSLWLLKTWVEGLWYLLRMP